METIVHLRGLLSSADQPRSETLWGEAYNPLCGDVWLLEDGRHIVVDYITCFDVGITFSDGERRGQKYRQSFGDWLRRQNAKLVSSFETKPFPGSDTRGWTAGTNCVITAEQSVEFINVLFAVGTRLGEQRRRKRDDA